MTADAISAANSFFELEPDAVRCPYRRIRELGEVAPVAWFDSLQAFVVTRYDLIVEVIRRTDIFSSRSPTGPQLEKKITQLMFELMSDQTEVGDLVRTQAAALGGTPVLVTCDPPEHRRQRGLVHQAFSPSAVKQLEPAIAELADGLIDQFIDGGEVDIAPEYAGPIPMTVIARALGVAMDRMPEFKRWSDSIVAGFGNTTITREQLIDSLQARMELSRYLLSVIKERETKPGEDLLSTIVHSRIDGEQLSHTEMVEMAAQFLVAGNETTTRLITFATLRLALNHELQSALRADPEKIPPFLEEVLRLEPPSNGVFRIATSEYVLDGVTIPAGAAVWMAFLGGNRDPQAFAEPDEMDLARGVKPPHLAFGQGPHFCLGANLARAEARIAIEALLHRCHNISLAIDVDDVVYNNSFLVHGVDHLPLKFTPAGS